MRIAFLSANGQLGGAETCLLDVLASVRAASPASPLLLVSAADGPLVARARALGAAASVVPFPPAVARLGETGAIASRGRARFAAEISLAAGPIAGYAADLRRALAAFAPDVVHTNGLKMHLLGPYAAGDAPIVWHMHEFVGARPVSLRLLRWTASRCAAVVANSDAVGADARSVLRTVPVTTVHNAVDLDRFAPSGDVEDLDRLANLPAAPAGTVRIGLVATFARWKGHATFIRAIAALRARRPVRAYIVGGPVYETEGSQYSIEELRQIAERDGAADRIGFTGFVDRPDAALRALDVVVHASTSPEPFGLVIAEAMACARAVVVSGAGGAAEIVTADVDALTHTPGSAGELAEAIRTLVDDPARRAAVAAAARATALRRFDRRRLASELMRIYEQVSNLKSQVSSLNSQVER